MAGRFYGPSGCWSGSCFCQQAEHWRPGAQRKIPELSRKLASDFLGFV